MSNFTLLLLVLAPVLQSAGVKDKPTEKAKPASAPASSTARSELAAEIILATDPLVSKRLVQARDFLTAKSR